MMPSLSGKDWMLEVNAQQKHFYESRYAAVGAPAEEAANGATNLWSWLRRRQQECRKTLGVRQAVVDLHRRWTQRQANQPQRVLDLGCFSGNSLSLELAAQA